MRSSAQPTTPSGAKASAPNKARRTAAGNAGPTPAMRQYLDQKERVGEAILLFRMGDFYETFYEDAKTLSRVLGLTLTARGKNSENPIPLAGVPYHTVDGYIAKLVRAGFKVAISEQVGDPKPAKGPVERKIDRIITPGTLTDEKLLDERSDNYLVALCPDDEGRSEQRLGLACVELASGRFFAQMVAGPDISDELSRLRPAELLMPDTDTAEISPAFEACRDALDIPVSPRPAHVFDPHTAERALCEHFRVVSLAGFGFDAFDASLCAAAALLDYLKETQRSALDHILRIVPRRVGHSVLIDQVALRSLEVERSIRDGAREGSLLAAVDMTVNPMGARRLRQWLCFPLRDPGEIRARQEAVAAFIGRPDRLARVRDLLRDMGDVERITARLGVGRASPRDMVALGSALHRCKELAALITKNQDETKEAKTKKDNAQEHDTSSFILHPSSLSLLPRLADDLGGHEALAGFLTAALKEDAPPVLRDGGFIADGHDAELDRLRNIGCEGNRWLAEFQAREAQRTGIPTLKVGYNSVFGYYIEITHQHRDKAPPEYVRKQTIRNAERYITDELKRHENEVLGAADRARQRELELFDEIRARAAADLGRLQATAEAVAVIDVLSGLAELARRRDYSRPELVEAAPGGSDARGGVLQIVDGRHPVLDVTMAERFVPNDCRLHPDGDQLLIITGPNMAGKSTYIRQIALLALLAQTGSYVPARSMRWSPVDRIFARVGASDELARGRSTFMVEMVETARILNNATASSLVILDELGRGTSTYDGLSLAWAVTEYIAEQIGCRTLFATHYHELTELPDQLPGAANFNVAVRERPRDDGTGREVIFLHKIVSGPTDRSYGVHVAAMAGLPASVLKRSEAVLAELERSFADESRHTQLSPKHRGEAGQLSLFVQQESMPTWWRELVDGLGAVDINHTPPVEALRILQRLQAILRERA